MKRLRVLTTLEELDPLSLGDSTAVVIDVMLATTTLITILENGAGRVFPVAGLAEAEEVCMGLDATVLVRGGEQDALPIEGYDCGPFPEEYHAELVRGRDVVYVSTNGTRAIARASAASRLLIANLRNAPAVARYLSSADVGSVSLICAGSWGRLALEDFTCAGVLLREVGPDGWRTDDAAWVALDLAERHQGREREMLRSSRAGRWFLEHGREPTFDFVTAVGASEMVGEVREGQLFDASVR
jgi:2-phosphosulfolactate phosphatase